MNMYKRDVFLMIILNFIIKNVSKYMG
jgi:hypothetical protein